MTTLAVCFVVSFVLMILVAILDKRHPDRLSRHGRQLAGIQGDAPALDERQYRQ